MYNEEYLTLEEASKYLRLSLGSIDKFISQNELQAFKKGRLIKRSVLEDFTETWGEREEFPD
ncbi:MAG: helix-turn-helix domain-containing protein [Dethiobacteria bacterium]|jgi:excisionase family DNA binding protein